MAITWEQQRELVYLTRPLRFVTTVDWTARSRWDHGDPHRGNQRGQTEARGPHVSQ